MKYYIRHSIIVILAVMALASCGGRGTRHAASLQVQPLPGVYIQYDSRASTFRMGNELIERRILINREKHLIFTTAFINKPSGRNYIKSLGEEFSFRANGTKLSGVAGDFEYVGHELFSAGGVKGLEVTLRAERKEIGVLRVKLVYEIYPHTPIIRKWIEIENPGGSSVTVDSIQVESLNLLPGYVALQSLAKSVGTLLSLIAFDADLSEGSLIGNEAPGVLKHSVLDPVGGFVSIGMKLYFQNCATEIQLAPNEQFISPAAFILLFKGDPGQAEKALAEFVAEYIARSKTPAYSMWYENIAVNMTESEAREKAQLAAESGANVFCLNGWADKRGDWTINGNFRLADFGKYVRELGMKFGLSIDLAIADLDSQFIAEYPQWVVKLKDSSDCNIDNGKMMCLGSEYTLYMAYEMDELVKELALDYIKLTGPMIPDEKTSGCFAEDHVHRSSAESLWYIYDGFFAMCRYLHSQHPDLIVDVSPESYNPGGTIDYALLKYADIGWPF